MPSSAPAEPAQGGSGTGSSKCDNLSDLYFQDILDASSAYEQGDTATYNSKMADASNDLKYAKNAGCDWAASIVRPGSTVGSVRVSVASSALRR